MQASERSNSRPASLKERRLGTLSTIPCNGIYENASIVLVYEPGTRSENSAILVVRLGELVLRRLGMYVQPRIIPGRLSVITNRRWQQISETSVG
jgi:hypothetical protein